MTDIRPPQPPPLDFTTPKKKKSNKTVIVVVSVVVLLMVAGIGVAIMAGIPFIKNAFDFETTEADYDLVVDIEDLAGWMTDYEPDLSMETFSKTAFLDMILQLEYEFDDSDNDDAPYLNCMVMSAASKQEAWTQYKTMWGGVSIGLKMSGNTSVSVKERNDLFRWGDDSEFGIVMNGEYPVGNAFITRKNKKVFFLMFTGVYFDNPESIESFLTPTLNRVAMYPKHEEPLPE